MPRVKTGTVRRKRHKKILKQTKGYWGPRNRLYKSAHEAYIRAGEHAFAGRRLKKRDMRTLWIQRINAALSDHNLRYSGFISLLRKSNINLDRKILAKLAAEHPAVFNQIVSTVKPSNKK